ncbi:hypothetical protein K443DRAFT_125727 [Laccaria amethystina LaAM-08-1]|uniref:Uncharacterized protein n=1 Tax=Laccaria amethystina LaAM-08-1 TaxID=1095629 RepID=A0A0C9X616_9AGAR|nr:hypothetical protein K443DRAFT_125727 [Laccaria amethystina LaAM-08-1]
MPPHRAPISAEFIDSDLDESQHEASVNSGLSSEESVSQARHTDCDTLFDQIIGTPTTKGKSKAKSKPRKLHGGATQTAKANATSKVRDVIDLNDEENATKKALALVTYNLAIFSASEHTKELKKWNGKNTFMKLDNNKPFDTWKAQLLVRINKILLPEKLDFNHYEVNFMIARISTALMAISCEEEYEDMLERLGKTKNPVCTILVQELRQTSSLKKREKENEPEGDEADHTRDDEHKSKKQRKSKPPKNSDISTANIPHNENIKSLHERWMCHKKPGCLSDHCFVNPNDGSHLFLDMHILMFGEPLWCANAELKGPTIAMLDTQPNHHLFNAISNNQLGQLSLLLEHHQRGNSTGSATAPVINFNIPAEFIQIFRPPAAPTATPLATAAAAAPATPIQPLTPPVFLPSGTLIPADRVPGPALSLDDFCKTYLLTDGVRMKLYNNGYSGSHTFQYAEWKDLKLDAGLKAGEIVQLKHAISLWSILCGL